MRKNGNDCIVTFYCPVLKKALNSVVCVLALPSDSREGEKSKAEEVLFFFICYQVNKN